MAPALLRQPRQRAIPLYYWNKMKSEVAHPAVQAN